MKFLPCVEIQTEKVFPEVTETSTEQDQTQQPQFPMLGGGPHMMGPLPG